jgi:hypothetical protein
MIAAHLLGLERHVFFEPVKMEINGGCEKQCLIEALYFDAHHSSRTIPVVKATSGGGIQAGTNQTQILKLRLS